MHADRPNILFLLGESHAADLLGCGDHPVIKTPNLDRLAAKGTRFEAAYCASPLCVPARAALATGLYPHQTGYWDSSMGYTGTPASWMARLRAGGYATAGIGKMHFRSDADDVGFGYSTETMQIADGIGDLVSALRYCGEEPGYPGLWQIWTSGFGPGDSPYRAYDQRIAQAACNWLTQAAPADQPWALSVHFIAAHAPFVAPQSFFDLYAQAGIPQPIRFTPQDRPLHETLNHLRRILCQQPDLPTEQVLAIRRAYYATVSYLDFLIGQVLDALHQSGQMDNTLIVYTSDHGFSLGDHYLFGLFHMHEEALRVPLLMAGPGVPEGRCIQTPVAHTDLAPTLLSAGGAMSGGDTARTLWPLLAGDSAPHGPVLAEYHATGTRTGGYVLRDGPLKLIWFVDETPQLYDLATDPAETRNLAPLPEWAGPLAQMETALRSILDPEAVDRAAKAAQADLVRAHGGKAAVLEKMGGFSYSPPPGVDWRDMAGNQKT